MENKKVIKNASWVIGVQIIRSIVAVVISMMTARFLGPSNYGLINYAASIVAFVAPVMYLGLSGILVQEIVNHPEKEGETIGTAITMSFCSSLVCIAGVVAFVYFVNAGEQETLIVCALYSILLIFQSIDLIQYWFQAKLISKYASITSFIVYLMIAGYKAFLLILHKSIFWFAISNALDYMLISFSLLIIYKNKGGQKLSFSWQTAKCMFARSKYYIFSDLMVTVFAQTDRIMLKLMVNDTATGYYSAAVACAGMTSFVFSAIIDSIRPMAFDYKREKDEEKYEKTIVCLYSLIIYLSLLQSIVMTISSPLIIKILYGKEYQTSVVALQIIVWYCSFSYLGGARAVWILAEEKQKHLVVINLVGACLNILLNWSLIPKFGINGAAIASVITQFFTNIVFVVIYKPTRRTGYLQLQALNPKYLYEMLRLFIKKKDSKKT